MLLCLGDPHRTAMTSSAVAGLLSVASFMQKRADGACTGVLTFCFFSPLHFIGAAAEAAATGARTRPPPSGREG